MSSVDLLLYRPWSDTTKKAQEEPVDFSSRGKRSVEPEADLGYTEIDSQLPGALKLPGINNKATAGNKTRVLSKCQSGTNLNSGVVDREFFVGSPDSGFSSPSDGTNNLQYHHLLPGLYQQALANHALQREAFYRDAIQREILSRQQLCLRPEFQDQKLGPLRGTLDHEQIAPLALVVKKDLINNNYFRVEASDYDNKCQNSVHDGSKQDSDNDEEEDEEAARESDNDLSSDRKRAEMPFEENKNRDGREGVIWESSKSSSHLVSVPETSPYHLFPPTLYWPHGSTPLGNQLAKPINRPFSSTAVIDHPLYKALPPPVSGDTRAGNMFATTNNSLVSPLGSHLSDSIANSLVGQQRQQLNGQLTSPLTSPAARAAYDLSVAMSSSSSPFGNFSGQASNCNLSPHLGTPSKSDTKSPSTSGLSLKRKLPAASFSPDKKSKSPKKTKASRRLNFDEDKSSPVSGTIIRELGEGEAPLVVRKGDIDPAYNVVEVTEEAKAEIAKIENKIGDYVCRLCKELYDDAFGLAQHRCSRIIHVEYRCPECDKVFNCPANLASHRRWHKPKGSAPGTPKSSDELNKPNTGFVSSKNSDDEPKPSTSKAAYEDEFPSEDDVSDGKESEIFDCTICFKSFKRQAYLRKHLLTHRREPEESSGTIVQPIPQKLPFTHTISDTVNQSHGGSLVPTVQNRIPAGHMLSPLSPPMLSPPFSPTEVFKCHICQSNFFSPTSLAIHFATAHQRDPRSHPGFTAGNGFVEIALSNLASSSNFGGSSMAVPRPQYSSGQPLHFSAQFLHRPSQISASS